MIILFIVIIEYDIMMDTIECTILWLIFELLYFNILAHEQKNWEEETRKSHLG